MKKFEKAKKTSSASNNSSQKSNFLGKLNLFKFLPTFAKLIPNFRQNFDFFVKKPQNQKVNPPICRLNENQKQALERMKKHKQMVENLNKKAP